MKTILAFTLLGVVAVAQAGVTRNVITDIITGIIDANRDKLANLNIPSIDLKEFGTVTDLTIQNLENFVLESLDSPGPLSVDISNATISLNTASATAAFNFINVEIPEIGLLVNGAGDLSGSATDLFLTVALNIQLDGIKITILDFSALDIRIGSINALLTGIDNADATNALINAELANYLNANLANIAYDNKDPIIAFINDILSGLGILV